MTNMDKQTKFRIDNIFIFIIAICLMIYLTVINVPEYNYHNPDLVFPVHLMNDSSIKYICLNTSYNNDSTALCNIDDIMEVS